MASNDDILKYIKEIDQKLIGLTEINARLTQEIVALKSGGNTVPQNRTFNFGVPLPPKPKGVIITIDEDTIKVSGNTYKHRGLFAECGGSWNGKHKHWEIHIDKKDELVETLKEKEIEHTVA